VARLIVPRETQADLDEILAHLAATAGISVALRYGERFRAAFRHLMDFPETEAMRPGLDANMRIRVVTPYVVFCRFAH
jgi:plasmid stabilization system protein ParE